MPKSSSLSLAMWPKAGKDENAPPKTSPHSPMSPDAVPDNGSEAGTPTAAAHRPPDSPSSPRLKDAKGIFSNFGASKSSSRISSPSKTERSFAQASDATDPNSAVYNSPHGGSTPELHRTRDTTSEDTSSGQRSDVPLQSKEAPSSTKARKGKLTRSRSTKATEQSGQRKAKGGVPQHLAEPTPTWKANGEGDAIKTAPLDKGSSWRQNMTFGKLRTQSADRHEGVPSAHGEDDGGSRKDKTEQSSVASGSFSENKGGHFMAHLGSASRKMGERMETARKGVLGKLGRSSSNNDKDLRLAKEAYQFKVINLPLIEQTRTTRISRRLEASKDKTEFWMPALPWRCIDYLNMKGCDEEGIYRVPGAAHTVKYYEQKFDQEHDIDLLGDANLNDPNVIGSLFKNWLRSLPDEIFPRPIQAKIQSECQGAKTTPQMLKDELSNLPPFHYYLLFAITCHISLLHSCAEQNKMNYNNLCICFQPAIKLDLFCFQFLILDWRNCWQGCWTEKEWLAQEQPYVETPKQPTGTSRNGNNKPGRAKPSNAGGDRSHSEDRSAALDRSKAPGRGLSSERKQGTDRLSPPNSSGISADSVPSSKQHLVEPGRAAEGGLAPERDGSTANRAAHGPGVDAGLGDEDKAATPTQAQHLREGSGPPFRLDLNNPPSSPFSIRF